MTLLLKEKFSVLMSVYYKAVPEELDAAVASVINQILPPDEIVIVKDGPLTEELDSAIDSWDKKYSGLFRIVTLPKNSGLGKALKKGVEACSYEMIARMDSDDISMPTRFQEQLDFMKKNPEVGVVSSWLGTFQNDPNDIIFIRGGPTSHKDISKLARSRFPMNHPASMLRRSIILSAGNYCHWPGLEDYYLWAQMLLNGTKMASIPKVLYKLRWDKNLVKRRSGFRRVLRQIRLQREFLKIGFISRTQFVRNVVIRTIASILPVAFMQRVRMKLKL